jgi:hypothetical protein
LNSRRAELLDLPRLVAQLVGLERRTARGGRDSIDHAPGAHDDVANAAAGALVAAAGLLSAADAWARFARSTASLALSPTDCGSSAVLYALLRSNDGMTFRRALSTLSSGNRDWFMTSKVC